MILSDKQKQGLETTVARFKARERFTVISGYAGSGKSTLVKFIVAALGFKEEEGDVAFCAPTGKAAQVLVRMGHKDATTIHRLLYEWIPKENGKYLKKRKWPLPKLVICDEVSMVSMEMAKELLSHSESYIIFCGDPAQLPPISKDDDNHLLDNPHVFLDEVHRQALGSDIIKLSLDVRQGRNIRVMQGNDVQIYAKEQFVEGMLTWADQILCATNRTRQELNQQMINLLGFTKPIDVGMKIICNRNNWDIISQQGEPIVNGTIGFIKKLRDDKVYLPQYFGVEPYDSVVVDLETETGDLYTDLVFDRQEILTGEPVISDPRLIYQINKYYSTDWAKENGLVNPLPLSANFGYAITTHRAQGSQWGKVLYVEERFPFEREEHQKHVYTGLTRAENKLVVIKKG